MKKTPRVLMDVRGRMGSYQNELAECARAELGRLGAGAGLGPRHELSLLLTDNPTIRRLNRQWRRIDRPTDVLSFPLQEIRAGAAAPEGPLGDIVISLPYLRTAARQEGVDPRAHLARLLAHGLLHLMGYDHLEDRDARKMEREEARLIENAECGMRNKKKMPNAE